MKSKSFFQNIAVRQMQQRADIQGHAIRNTNDGNSTASLIAAAGASAYLSQLAAAANIINNYQQQHIITENDVGALENQEVVANGLKQSISSQMKRKTNRVIALN